MSDQYGALPHYEKEIERLRVALADATDGLEHAAARLHYYDHSALVDELQPYIYRAVAALERGAHA